MGAVILKLDNSPEKFNFIQRCVTTLILIKKASEEFLGFFAPCSYFNRNGGRVQFYQKESPAKEFTWCRFDVFIVNGVVLVSISLTLNRFDTFFRCSIVDFEQIIVAWAVTSSLLTFNKFATFRKSIWCLYEWLATSLFLLATVYYSCLF